MFQSRTHTCNELRLGDVGRQVKIVGWMENVPFSFPLRMLYVMGPLEPPVWIALGETTGVPKERRALVEV